MCYRRLHMERFFIGFFTHPVGHETEKVRVEKNGRGKIWKRLKETRSIFHSRCCFRLTPRTTKTEVLIALPSSSFQCHLAHTFNFEQLRFTKGKNINKTTWITSRSSRFPSDIEFKIFLLMPVYFFPPRQPCTFSLSMVFVLQDRQ